jgi:hypothetical protein
MTMGTRRAFAGVLIFVGWSISAGFSVVDATSSAKTQAKGDVVDHPRGCIAIHQEKGGLVQFEVFLIEPTQRLVPIEAYRISVTIPGKLTPVWVAQGEDYSSTHRITYGVAPTGFKEQVPPEQLMPGISYRVVVRSFSVGGIQRVFLHEGGEKRNTCPWDGRPQS